MNIKCEEKEINSDHKYIILTFEEATPTGNTSSIIEPLVIPDNSLYNVIKIA